MTTVFYLLPIIFIDNRAIQDNRSCSILNIKITIIQHILYLDCYRDLLAKEEDLNL